MKNEDVAHWLEISASLMAVLKPAGSGVELFGHGMPAEAFAGLVDREAERVGHALVALATGAGETECRAILAQLEADTLIALFSRWAHYTQAWRAMLEDPHPHLWMPPRDTWRAVFLAMTGENLHSTAAARSLWPESF
jgi:hypothetical protein